jgi:hypothetical protein
VKSDESNGSQREQVSENLVDDEEPPPSVSIIRMGTCEVMPREAQVQAPGDISNQDPPSSIIVEPPSSPVHQEESQVHGDDHGQGFDQGENKVVNLKKKLHKLKMMMMNPFNINLKHHTQEYIKWFNGIISSTTYLGLSKEG